MVPFSGYSLPVQYPTGIIAEHKWTREHAGLFDVSHMGQVMLRARSGEVGDAALALERLVPQDMLALPAGRQRYAQFTNAEGGILDDLMVANFGDHLFVVVNAACKEADEVHLRAHLSDSCRIDSLPDRALLALQGPAAERVLAKFCAEAAVVAATPTKTSAKRNSNFSINISLKLRDGRPLRRGRTMLHHRRAFPRP